ncbi:alpha-L-fucosidase [Prolixibacter denitrificans]|uniref:alpha-L-fucosidase n=1 Tax=Prolixibacter denitrificans TaxID=1541063 RepID=A0A2P8CGB0_9BACT|nr:alpha-L-fucosidase [Prolixibacter denitrificans]PSK84011.1 alpha-L-fucosidase [Prolixibacter denitrificans]GET23553.1 alpha-L-fucosidase [Prolixibacter denitrificans]
MNRILPVFLLLFLLVGFKVKAQNTETSQEKAKRMAWFKDAKLGIFIHWGIYAVNGIDESWSFYNGYISYPDYMKQLKGFTAANYHPEEWAKLIKESGAKYTVLTTKHHDGVALWDTECSDLNVVKKTPAGRDLVAPFVKAARKEGLKVGLYYSLLDWSNPNYPNWTREKKRYTNDSVRWNRFVKFNFCQLEELSKKFHPALFWFDGDWEQSAEKWHAKELAADLRKYNKNVILNSRIQGYGDYETPEQGLPVTKPESKYWELCMTMNDSWGYQPNDTNYKSANQIIRMLVECICMGGNLLLDIGPKADGTIPQQQVDILKELGRWTSKHKEAIYGTRAGIPPEHFYGPTALNQKGDILYLYLPYKPVGPLMIKGLKNKINRIWVVGNGTKLNWKVIGKQYWSSVPGIVYIDVPERVLDPQVTVIAVLLDGKIDLYREKGQVIESN